MARIVSSPALSNGGAVTDILAAARQGVPVTVTVPALGAGVELRQVTDTCVSIMPLVVCPDGVTFAPDDRDSSGRGALTRGLPDRHVIGVVLARAERAAARANGED